MSKRTEFVAGDTNKPVEGTLVDEDGPTPLLGASIEFRMEPVPESGLEVPVVIGDAEAVDAAAPVGHPDCGKVRYQWGDGDTDVPGIYRAQFRVEFAGGVETFPTGYVEIVIKPLIS